ncbi:MAG TPA: DUF3828 domain-containing protein [Thermoanaerobaculia bacterium]|nr:DUF3828 domain-containing protein [Thermoanaerobaculia bacterium]
MKLNRIFLGAALAATLVSCGGESPAPATETAAPPTASAAPAAAPPAQPALADAAKLVEELYKNHTADQGPFFQFSDRARVDRYFEKELADLIWKDAVEVQGEVGALEFDPLYASQDTEITNLAVQPATADGTNARVVVAFLNHGAKEQITYSLAPTTGSWKIADIHYGDGSTLGGIYRTYAAETETSTAPPPQ